MRRNGIKKFRVSFRINLTVTYKNIQKIWCKRMVSKHYTILSLLLPVAMLIGTSFAIYVHQQSNKLLTIMIYIFGFIVICIFAFMTIQSLKKNNHKNYISK